MLCILTHFENLNRFCRPVWFKLELVDLLIGPLGAEDAVLEVFCRVPLTAVVDDFPLESLPLLTTASNESFSNLNKYKINS